MSDKPVRENIRQHQALLAYSSMPDPSLQKLHQTWAEYVPKFKKPAFRTLKSWSAKYQWVERSQAIHQAAKDEAIKKIIANLTMGKEEILAITRAVMIRYGAQLKDNLQGRLTILDFERAWRIQRIELGLPTEIGSHEVAIKDCYEGISDEELILQLEELTAKYKERLSRQQVV
ncbi:MAG: hypothetical protein G01um10147_402 [Microgenomates group bacterium Gr01-1014_7]|nr:MAG: hypothetical protein G01um10147_402 [Microgenomates group bacterium Gr01-1014_7]